METKIKPGVAALGFKDTYMKFRDSSHIAVRLPFPIQFSIWAIVPGLAVRPGTCYVVPSVGYTGNIILTFEQSTIASYSS